MGNAVKNILNLQANTEAHYDTHPFEFLTQDDEKMIEALQPDPFLYFVKNYLKKNSKIADIGCGGGRATLYLTQQDMDTYAFDLSMRSLQLTRARCKKARYTGGTNLSLPFKTEVFDAVVSDGVIHHTPDAIQSLKENTRILKREGFMYLAIYKKEGYYYYVYTYLGKPIRWLSKNKVGRIVIIYSLGLLYHFLHKFKKKSPKTWRGSQNFFYDYLITPIATFYKKNEIKELAFSLGLNQKYYDSIGNVHVFIFKKNSINEKS